MSDRTAGAAYFRQFAEFARGGLSPLYERLALAIADDPEMLTFAALAKPGQPQANLLLAAVHAVLLAGTKHPLGEYYPTLGGKLSVGSGDVYALFREFVQEHRVRIETFIKTRVTNTNEVGRSALIYPVLDLIARESGQPLNTIEIGPSAGLNLNWHRYGYRYLSEAGEPLAERNVQSPLMLTSQLRGAYQPKLAEQLPVVESSCGLELNPVDATKPSDLLWLRALVWPERVDRLKKLDAALAIAQRHPPKMRTGNAVRDLAPMLNALPTGRPATIVHTLVLYQFDPAATAAFEAALHEAARTRTIYRVSVEFGIEPGNAHHPVELFKYRDSARSRRPLARCDPHGGWLEWVETDRI